MYFLINTDSVKFYEKMNEVLNPDSEYSLFKFCDDQSFKNIQKMAQIAKSRVWELKPISEESKTSTIEFKFNKMTGYNDSKWNNF